MRLGQVKRTHNIESSKIVSFLKKQGIEISDHPNSKLTDEQLKLVLENLEPKKEEPKTKSESKTKETTIETSEIKKEEPKVGDIIEIKKEEKVKKSTSESPKLYTALGKDENADVEVIRAPKQKVEGIKILGKIDLPEPTKIQKTVEETVPTEKNTSEIDIKEDPLSHLHPNKRAKLKAKEKIDEVNSKELKVEAVKEKKKVKSISEKVAEEKQKSEKKKKKANPHKHMKKAGLTAQRIEISADGKVLPKGTKPTYKTENKPGLFARIWKWFNT